MQIPLSWLQDYIDLPDSIDELSDLLTFSGLEVEGIETHGSDYEGICSARITAVNPHPDADKLTLCTIDFGQEEPMEVVCGAPNVRVGLNTIYAQVGTKLPNGMKLKKAKIRGVVSLGMLCAEDELGLSSDHTGIMELPEDTEPGTPASNLLGGPEVVFDLEVTPNRPDCLSVIGVARELAALTGGKLRLPDISLPEPTGEATQAVTISAPSGCPRYTARILGNATIAPSPDWMQQRLRLCGVRPINNVVDITNYVMLETGQPLHAFDRTLLKGDTIHIRPATAKEPLQTLDGDEHELTTEDWVIADETQPVALAGVMGGANSDIKDSTKDILLESAAFNPANVRHTAKRLQAHTESSYRFSRGCDVTRVDWVSHRAAALLVEHAGASLCGPLNDVYPGEEPLRTLECTWEAITSLIGIDIPIETMVGYLTRLELDIVSQTETGCTIRIPGHRSDLARPVDITEEIARLNGLDAIPVSAPVARIVPGARDPEVRAEARLCEFLAHRGLLEAFHYTLSSEEARKGLDEQPAEHLPNPINQDQSLLRTSLLPQMVNTLAFNRAHQCDAVALFEIGKAYFPAGESIREARHLCLGAYGPWKRQVLDRQRDIGDLEAFLNLKGELEALLTSEHVEDPIVFRPATHPAFAPGQSAEVVLGDQAIGWIGLLAPAHLREHKLAGPVALAEISLEHLLTRETSPSLHQALSAFPSTSRDVALLVDRTLGHQDVMDVVNQRRPKELESVEVFDLFESEKLGGNRKSLAYRFTYRSAKKTLTDESVERIHNQLVERLISGCRADIVGR